MKRSFTHSIIRLFDYSIILLLTTIYQLPTTNFAHAGEPLGQIAANTEIPLMSDIPEASLAPTGITEVAALQRPETGDAVYLPLYYGHTNLTADTSNWIDGQAVLALINPGVGYSVASNIHLVGYGDWPTNAFQSVCWRVGGDIHANVITSLDMDPPPPTAISYVQDGLHVGRHRKRRLGRPRP